MGQRTAGLDIGEKRIGVAVSDGLGLTAQPLVTIERCSIEADVDALMRALEGYEVATFVAGLPLEMSAKEGLQANRVRHFGQALAERSGLQVVYQDERLTTVESRRLLIASGVRRRRRRAVVDKLAACLILQSYLDATAPEEPSS